MRKLIQRALSRFGYQLVYFGHGNKAPPGILDAFFQSLKYLDFEATHIVDIGANRGHWTRAAMRYFPTPGCAYTLVEPQDRLRVTIKDLESVDTRLVWLPVGAGDRRARLKLTVPIYDTSASFSRIVGPAGDAQQEIIEVDVLTLDEIIAASSFGMPQIVKIDAEGFDMRVVDGAKSLLGKTDIFLIEVALFDPEAENKMTSAVATMEQHGYVPLDITDLNRCAKTGALWLCEIAFARKNSLHLKNMPPYMTSFRPELNQVRL